MHGQHNITVNKYSKTDIYLSANMQDIAQSDVAVADRKNTEIAYKNAVLMYIQQIWCRWADMGQVTTKPTFASATALVPKARSNNLKLLNLKGGMFKNTQKEAVLGTCHTAEKFSGLQSHLTPHPVHLIKLVLTD
jgi:hypothetical protein